MFTVINLVLLLSILLNFQRPDKIYIIGLAIVLIIINWLRYERDFDISELETKWGNEPTRKKKTRLTILIAYLLLTCLTPWIYGLSSS